MLGASKISVATQIFFSNYYDLQSVRFELTCLCEQVEQLYLPWN